jgi:2',3'-cyclic-nucleotide 2'-phosphodiesterase
LNILFIGDIYGSPGKKAVKECVPQLRKELNIDFCIANGENSAAGSGITYIIAQELYKAGVDCITMGNHTWSKKEILNFIDSDNKIVRPANYPQNVPGRGYTILKANGRELAVLNLMGRVYMDSIECPFTAADRELKEIKAKTKVVFVDMHAEATSEKIALAWYLDGRISCLAGTHTHVQTADERILPFGTGLISDVGMTGPYDGIIGVDKEMIIDRFITRMPHRFEVARGRIQFCAVYLEVDDKTGKCTKIERIFKILDDN